MRLSEAIRLGSLLGPQSHHGLHVARRKYIFFGPVVNEYCALGAAFAATGASKQERVYHADGSVAGFRGKEYSYKAGDKYTPMVSEFDEFLWVRVSCPICLERQIEPLYRAVPHLNDFHKWTRSQIADWVETIERAHEPQPQTCLVRAMEPAVATTASAAK